MRVDDCASGGGSESVAGAGLYGLVASYLWLLLLLLIQVALLEAIRVGCARVLRLGLRGARISCGHLRRACLAFVARLPVARAPVREPDLEGDRWLVLDTSGGQA